MGAQKKKGWFGPRHTIHFKQEIEDGKKTG